RISTSLRPEGTVTARTMTTWRRSYRSATRSCGAPSAGSWIEWVRPGGDGTPAARLGKRGLRVVLGSGVYEDAQKEGGSLDLPLCRIELASTLRLIDTHFAKKRRRSM